MNCLGNWGVGSVSKCLMFERGDTECPVWWYYCDSNTGEDGIGGLLGLAGQPVWWLLVGTRHGRESV